ncbi:hypothetical protein [Burkholderia lata]|uniref:Lipopolysaccharide assembly protein B n=1 Tax=Burkholderia lata (strain ATCC 17760 / DSM 23089 / LMG 22485 / NCIMB 9086 / R18194 / 383) TaxID=482957 RepID=A0A6P2UD97_BURL3|nr:hypothetical protein [Burkholderia lata]VWC68136.1 hypothetical protein BLA18109_02279 [Burkholderia lata]
MRVLPNRARRARDGWRAILNARAEARRTASFRCKECGFVAFRALEHCPVCGRWNWPFDPVRVASSDTHATHAAHSFHTWSSRIARALRNAAFRRPRASSAPILSILTLVLLVGGYVMVDRTCKADPVCRGSNGSSGSGVTATNAAPYASNDPVLPVLPAPVYPFHTTDRTQEVATQRGSPDIGASAGQTTVARATPAMRAPDRSHATTGTMRLADWKASRGAAHRTRAFHRVSVRTAHARRTTASNTQIAQLYRGH